MEFYFLLIILSIVTSASSKAFNFIPSDLTEEVPKSLSRVKRDIHDDSMKDYVLLPKFSIYLIGFSMLLMLIVIVILAVVLYLVLEKKSIFGINATNKQYVRQESTGVVPLYSATYEEQNKNNGSTLTVNSGIIEISEPRASDPITPTRLEESKIIFAKRPLKAIVPVMHKGQMDAICKEVLRKVQKSDSASFRDLNDLLKFEKKNDNIGMKSEDIKESEKEDKNEEKAEFKAESQLFKLKKPEIKTETQKEIKTKIQDEHNTKLQEELNSKMQEEFKTKIQEELNSKMQEELKTKIQEELKTKNETKPKIKEEKINETEQETINEPVSEPKPDAIKDARMDKLESDKNEDDSDSETEYDTVPSPIRFRRSGPEPDQALYDTVPNPIKYRHSDPETDHLDQSLYDTVATTQRVRHSGAETDDDIDDIYDLPPNRDSLDGQPRNVIQMDPDTHYLMPFSSQRTDSCYVNAKTKRQSFKSP